MQVLRQAVDSLAARGTAVVVGAPPFGTEVGLDVNGLLGGKHIVGITLGDSETQTFIPVLAAMVADGRLPVGELVTHLRLRRHRAGGRRRPERRDHQAGPHLRPDPTTTHHSGAHSHMDITGKVAVVTGAGQGLGRAYAIALAEAGAAVVVNDVNAETAGAVVDDDQRGGRPRRRRGRCRSAPRPPPSSSCTARCAAFGRLDVMVTNAGVLRDRVLWNMSDEDFDTVVQVHLRGTFTCAREAAKQFRAQGEGGRLILAGSPAGQRGNFGQTNYAAAKAGIVAMARTWAMELARAGVTVNAVVPNAATAMTETIPFLAPYVEQMAQGLPVPSVVRRAASFGTPEDVAGLIVYLASDASGGVTGQAIGIGGDRLSLWSHPTEIRSAFRDGGWTADAIAEAFESTVAEVPETYGIPAPKLPELQPPGRVTMAEPYVPGLDVGALTAIDVHTHAETDGCGHYSLPEELPRRRRQVLRRRRRRTADARPARGVLPRAQDGRGRVHRRRRVRARAHPDRQRGRGRGRPPQRRRAASPSPASTPPRAGPA